LNILITTLGSHGDLHPFLGIAAALQACGHLVKVLASAYYDSLVRAMGLDFVPLGTAEDFLSVARDPDVWHPQRGIGLIAQSLGKSMQRGYKAILEHAVPGKTVLVYSTLAFEARVAQETLGLPGVTVHLSPSIFRSVYDSPKITGMPMPAWLPKRVKEGMFELADRLIIDPLFGKPINAFRASLALLPVHGILADWCHSPQRVIGLFPAWYAAPQPDWPHQAVVTGFPLFDEKEVTPIPENVKAFLDAGSPPIVFTPGSAMVHGHDFFAAAVRACQIMGRRALLLTRHAEQIPANLPEGIFHAPYAPFSQVLPRSAAVVHHGGIGSTAQAMACGVPQLLMPMGFDQPDNAARIKALGVGDYLQRHQFEPDAVAAKLRGLLQSAKTTKACRTVAGRFKTEPNALAETVRVIEETAP